MGDEEPDATNRKRKRLALLLQSSAHHGCAAAEIDPVLDFFAGTIAGEVDSDRETVLLNRFALCFNRNDSFSCGVSARYWYVLMITCTVQSD